LKITKEYILDKNKTTKPGTLKENMLIVSAPAPAVLEQVVMLKNMVLDLG